MIEPDLTGRCLLCDAGLGGHFIDCPGVLDAAEPPRPEPVDLDEPKEN